MRTNYLLRQAKKILRTFNIEITNYDNFKRLTQDYFPHYSINFDFIQSLDYKSAKQVINDLKSSKSQRGQDFFALYCNDFQSELYFVEFGATNGVINSNTYMLEKNYSWKGILAEPQRSMIRDLEINRNANVEASCVWKNSGEQIIFNEIGDLSTIDIFSDSDEHSATRVHGTRYYVETISLTEMLNKWNAPKNIHFISIDTEGSEFEILKAFDFNLYSFKCICVEHNWTLNRVFINQLLESKGYSRVWREYSGSDDWYVHEEILTKRFLGNEE